MIEYLNAWHHHSPTQPSHQYSPLLQQAIRQQSQIGWQSFIEGFWSSTWRKHQEEYLKSIKTQRSALLWASRLQRRIWQIAWTMWEHRNNILHSDGKTIHQYETKLVDQEINIEWERSHSLPQQYQHLFSGTLQQKLTSDIHTKRRWLSNVWIAQEVRQQLRDDRNEHVVMLFNQWKAFSTKL